MSGYRAISLRDRQGLQSELERQARAVDDATTADVVIDPTRRLLLRSPNGTFWSVTVNDAGVLSTVNMGPNPL